MRETINANSFSAGNGIGKTSRLQRLRNFHSSCLKKKALAPEIINLNHERGIS